MNKYIASVSWGKDSTAMLLKLIELKYPLDEVVFYDTKMEFEEIYKTRDIVVENILKPLGIKYTELTSSPSFIELMTSYKRPNGKIGYGWCGGMCRWGTSRKLQSLDKYTKGSIVYIGIAYDEEERYLRLAPNKKAPLHDLGITESEALKICYENNLTFGGLYKILKRVSCWCCRNKNLKELKNYKEFLPKYYEKLKELEKIIGEPMKKPYYLKQRFEGELNGKETD